MRRSHFLPLIAATVGILAAAPALAQDAAVRVAYQTVVEPAKVAQADGVYEKATGKTIVLVTHGVEEAVFLATDLVLLSLRPARVAQRYAPGFGRRHTEGEGARVLKSLPEFVALRERVLADIHALDPALQEEHAA